MNFLHKSTHTYHFVFISCIGNVSLPDFRWTGDHYLYTTKCNYVDLNADENGLWAIYATSKSSNTYVIKVRICIEFIGCTIRPSMILCSSSRLLHGLYRIKAGCYTYHFLSFCSSFSFYLNSAQSTVIQLDAITLEIQYGWNISINHNKVSFHIHSLSSIYKQAQTPYVFCSWFAFI